MSDQERGEPHLRFPYRQIGMSYTVTKSDRQKRVEALADLVGSVVGSDDEDIIYEAIDELREIWRRTEDLKPGFRLAPVKAEGESIEFYPTTQRSYANLAVLAEQTQAVLRRDGRRIERLKRRIRRLKKRMG